MHCLTKFAKLNSVGEAAADRSITVWSWLPVGCLTFSFFHVYTPRLNFNVLETTEMSR